MPEVQCVTDSMFSGPSVNEEQVKRKKSLSLLTELKIAKLSYAWLMVRGWRLVILVLSGKILHCRMQQVLILI